ncbi:MAG: MFS family permease [Ilumatobacter sp.]|jgi:MFS family permease
MSTEPTQDTAVSSDASAPKPPSPRAILWAVGFSVFVAADDLTVVSTMLRPIIGDLGLVLPDGLDDAAWVVNAYLIAFIAVMPIAGRISDVLGRRRTFVIAYVIFMIGTIWIPLSTSLGPFLVGRVLTAVGGGAMVPVALAVVGDVYPEAKRARALGTLGAIETLGWVWGPLYGAMLVRFFDWRLQFWLNVPLALIGLAAVWWALSDHDRPERTHRIDWLGAGLLTTTLVSLNLALLGSAEVQSVQGLDQLTGNGGTNLRLLYPVAFVAGIAFVMQQRRSSDPLVEASLFAGRNVRVALIVNFVIGAALVIAMVDVPLFVNAIEVDLERSAVIAGWILSALTASMAVMSYVGGRITEHTWYGPPIILGLVAATVAYGLMGFTWGANTPYPILALQLALLGAGFGLTTAPTTSAVVDHAAPEHRGSAAAVVMVVRLLGLSVGLSALTAWGLARFNALRGDIELPALTDPGFEAALRTASADLTSTSIAETFLATAALLLVGFGIAALMLRRTAATSFPTSPTSATSPTSPTSPTSHIFPHPQTEAPMASDDTPLDDSVTTEQPMLADSLTDTADEAVPDVGGWQRHLGKIVGAFALLLLAAFALIAVLFTQLQSTQGDLDAATASLQMSTDDIARVEAGAALYASQVTGFQEQISELQPTIQAGLDDAVEGLQTFSESTLEFTVNIDESIDINTDVVIARTVQVPIKTTLPINEEFDTTIIIDGPFGTEIPLDITVPINLDVPIDITVDIPLDETIPINASVPVKVDVPIGVNVGDTQLADLAESLAIGLESFTQVLNSLGG